MPRCLAGNSALARCSSPFSALTQTRAGRDRLAGKTRAGIAVQKLLTRYFAARDGSPILTVAGLWDEWKNRQTGEPLKSCTMIITEPNEFVAEVHDRMPVLLTEGQFAPWRSWEVGTEVLKPALNDYLQRWPVSKRVE
jgi:putative SOS response-associated peptidase YedK